MPSSYYITLCTHNKTDSQLKRRLKKAISIHATAFAIVVIKVYCRRISLSVHIARGEAHVKFLRIRKWSAVWYVMCAHATGSSRARVKAVAMTFLQYVLYWKKTIKIDLVKLLAAWRWLNSAFCTQQTFVILITPIAVDIAQDNNCIVSYQLAKFNDQNHGH